jgi:hypothetical protein
MRKMKLCIHATNVTSVEGPRESFKRTIGQLDLRRIVSVVCCDGDKLIEVGHKVIWHLAFAPLNYIDAQ